MAYQLDDLKDVKQTIRSFGSAPPAPAPIAAPTPSPLSSGAQSYMDSALDEEGDYTTES